MGGGGEDAEEGNDVRVRKLSGCPYFLKEPLDVSIVRVILIRQIEEDSRSQPRLGRNLEKSSTEETSPQ